MILPALLEKIHIAHPNLQLQIMEAVEDKLAAALAANDIDVALSGAIPEDESIMRVAEHKFADRSMVIAAVSHPLQQRDSLHVHDLAAESWIMPSTDAEPRKRFDELMCGLGATPARVVVERDPPPPSKRWSHRRVCSAGCPNRCLQPSFAARIDRPRAAPTWSANVTSSYIVAGVTSCHRLGSVPPGITAVSPKRITDDKPAPKMDRRWERHALR